ncbi:MAG: vacuolar protein sorting 53 [Amphiamblys sp. WSBS2006]|nr:MAG: vacuolar protein sorting 53 [Amphiamblys sp. WSBS2006]OIR59024.1 MAG: vacuolar protein sorting 53 [Amphiamblys sp. WSBS2006]
MKEATVDGQIDELFGFLLVGNLSVEDEQERVSMQVKAIEEDRESVLSRQKERLCSLEKTSELIRQKKAVYEEKVWQILSLGEKHLERKEAIQQKTMEVFEKIGEIRRKKKEAERIKQAQEMWGEWADAEAVLRETADETALLKQIKIGEQCSVFFEDFDGVYSVCRKQEQWRHCKEALGKRVLRFAEEKIKTSSPQMQTVCQLADACGVRDGVVHFLSEAVLHTCQDIFNPAECDTKVLFKWFQRLCDSGFDGAEELFPGEWNVRAVLTAEFGKRVKKTIEEALRNTSPTAEKIETILAQTAQIESHFGMERGAVSCAVDRHFRPVIENLEAGLTKILQKTDSMLKEHSILENARDLLFWTEKVIRRYDFVGEENLEQLCETSERLLMKYVAGLQANEAEGLFVGINTAEYVKRMAERIKRRIKTDRRGEIFAKIGVAVEEKTKALLGLFGEVFGASLKKIDAGSAIKEYCGKGRAEKNRKHTANVIGKTKEVLREAERVESAAEYRAVIDCVFEKLLERLESILWQCRSISFAGAELFLFDTRTILDTAGEVRTAEVKRVKEVLAENRVEKILKVVLLPEDNAEMFVWMAVRTLGSKEEECLRKVLRLKETESRKKEEILSLLQLFPDTEK